MNFKFNVIFQVKNKILKGRQMIENLIPISEIEAWENIMLMLSGNLSQVPKIATYAKKVISAGKTANGIRDRIFWKKFYKLLDEESLTPKQREKFLKKLAMGRRIL
ncbi:MAG: hypothetical protein HFE72_00895 [Emergencia sp.]|nr:hypothetical protein [Emergencia sp.]